MSDEQRFWACRFLEIIEGVLVWKFRHPALHNSYEADALFNSKYAGEPAGGKSGQVRIMGSYYSTEEIKNAILRA